MFDIVSVGLNASSPRRAVQARSSLSRSLTLSNLPCDAASRRDERDEESMRRSTPVLGGFYGSFNAVEGSRFKVPGVYCSFLNRKKERGAQSM